MFFFKLVILSCEIDTKVCLSITEFITFNVPLDESKIINLSLDGNIHILQLILTGVPLYL